MNPRETRKNYFAYIGVIFYLTGYIASAQTLDITSSPFNASTSSADNASAIQAAINAVGSGGTVLVPSGTFLSGPLTLKSNMTFQIASGGTLKMTAMGTFPASSDFLFGSGLSNITINGSGVMDGQGAAWWSAFNSNSSTTRPPAMIELTGCTGVTVQGITVKDSPKFHVQFLGNGNNIYAAGLSITAAWPSPNTDGIDLRGTNVLIENCYISDGDDVIQLGGSSNLTSGVTIRNCNFGTGHGLSIGGYTQGGVNNVLVDSCTFNGTQYGIRWKSGRDRGGMVTGLTYSNITMTGILNYPFYLTSWYPNSLPPSSDTAAATTSTTPYWENITLRNITASTASGAQGPGIFWAVPEAPVTNLLFDGVTVTGPNGVTLDIHHARATTFTCNCRVDGAAPPTNIGLFDAVVSFPPCGPTPTPGNPTNTPTKTFTATVVPPTSTFTPTKTNTPMPATNTFTLTPTNTLSATPTSTATRTNTPVPPTSIFTNTPIPPTSTFTPTHTNTPVPPTATFTPVPPTATFTFTSTRTNTPVPPTATFTPVPPTATHTNTPVPPTATNTPMPPTPTNTPIPPTSIFTPVPPTATSSFTSTHTNTPAPPTSTFTPVPPTATNTPVPPTFTFTATMTHTNTSVPPTATNTPAPPTSTFTPVPSTPTNTPVPPTFTFTTVPPTATRTNTPVPPTSTFTNSPVPPTSTPTNTAVPPTPTLTPANTATPTATRTNTPVPTNTFTFVPPTATPTNSPVPPTSTFTAVPPTSTFTRTSTFTPTNTAVPPTDTPTSAPSSISFKVQLLSGVTTDSTNSPHPQIQVVNTGTGPLNLNNVTVRYWFNCDCTTQTLQAWVDWAGLMPTGTNVTGNAQVSVQPTSLGGQTNYILYTFTGNMVLQPGQSIQVQSRFNKSDWSNMLQDNDWSFSTFTSFTDWTHVTGYLSGALVWGQEPATATTSALMVTSAVAFPNPSTGNGVNLSFTLDGSGLDSGAKVTLKIYTLHGRRIWSTTLTGASVGTVGNHPVFWNQKDSDQDRLANGVYILRVTVESQGQTSSTTTKILILG